MSTTSTTNETANNAQNNTPNKNGVPKQVKFAANPVMISHAPPNAAIVLPTAKTEGHTIDSQTKMQSTSTNVITTPSQSNVPPSPNKGSPSTVKGTIPVTDLVDPNIVKNVIVSVPPAGSDHTYAKTSPKKKSTNEISSSDDTSSSSSEDMETEETKEKGSVSTTPTTLSTPTTKSTKPKQTASMGKQRGRPRKNANTTTPSVTTPTPRSILKSTPEIKVDYERVRRRGRGCGNCAGCLRDDCGKCCYCLDKPKFGGPGRKKQRCALRICAHFVSLKSSPGVRNSVHSKAAAILSIVSSPEIASVTSTPTSTSTKKSDPVVTTTKTTEQTKPSVTTAPSLSSISSTTGTAVITSSPNSTPQTQGTPRPKQGGGTSGALSGDHIKCVMCGRERKVNMSRSNKFCGARCLKTWEELNPGKNPETAEPRTLSLPMILQASMEKPMPRALRNLQIDMALPGGFHQTPLSSVASLSSAGDLLTIGPLISSITSAVSNMTVPTAPTIPNITNGIKRPSQEQPPIPSKKSKTIVSSSSVLVSSTPVVTTPTISPSPVPKGKKKTRSDLPSDVSKWSILEVMQYFEGTPDCTHIAPVLQEQEVDGEALFLLSHDSLVKCLGMKLGPALKVMTHVERLKSQTSSLV